MSETASPTTPNQEAAEKLALAPSAAQPVPEVISAPAPTTSKPVPAPEKLAEIIAENAKLRPEVDAEIRAYKTLPADQQPEALKKLLNYERLMAATAKLRNEFLISVETTEEGKKFIYEALTPSQRGVIMAGTENCGGLGIGKAARTAWANKTEPENAAADAAKEIGGSLFTGLLDRALPGARRVITGAQDIQKIKGVADYLRNIDYCDMTAEDKVTLLRPSTTPSAKTDKVVAEEQRTTAPAGNPLKKLGGLLGF